MASVMGGHDTTPAAVLRYSIYSPEGKEVILRRCLVYKGFEGQNFDFHPFAMEQNAADVRVNWCSERQLL